MRLKEIDTLPPKDKLKEEVIQKTEEYIKNLSYLQEKVICAKKTFDSYYITRCRYGR